MLDQGRVLVETDEQRAARRAMALRLEKIAAYQNGKMMGSEVIPTSSGPIFAYSDRSCPYLRWPVDEKRSLMIAEWRRGFLDARPEEAIAAKITVVEQNGIVWSREGF
jgi:hypothetical protein